MVHAIHAGDRRQNPLVVIGFAPPPACGTANSFAHVRFPAELSNCLNCHLDTTFTLPLKSGVLATTVNTGSTYGPGVTTVLDSDPGNDKNITPTAAVCSACHDGEEAKRHMVRTGGASFTAFQSQITSGVVKERCVKCHGRGREEDVMKVHEIQSRSGDRR